MTEAPFRRSHLLFSRIFLPPCSSPPPEVRRWGNLKETLLRFQRTHDFGAAFEALTEGELAGDYFNALGNHRQELLRQHVGRRLWVSGRAGDGGGPDSASLLLLGVPLPQCLPAG